MDLGRGRSCPIASKRRRPSAEGGACIDRSRMEDVLEVLLTDLDAGVTDAALEHILHRQSSDDEKVELLDRCLALGLQLQGVANRLAREHAAQHNSSVWPFTPDLSIKIFSSLGTQTLCQAAAACTMFSKLALEAACYTNIDLTTGGSTVTDETVEKVIHRAGRCLRSLKLGVVLHHCRLHGLKPSSSPLKFPVIYDRSMFNKSSEWTACPLSKSCLRPLIVDGVAGRMLKALHLYNIESMDSKFLCKALMACPALMDLKVVGLNVSLTTLMDCLGTTCHELEGLCCQQANLGSWPGHNVKFSACSTLVKGCPKLLSLTLSEYRLADRKASVLLTGLEHLTHADFSGADYLNGFFLRNLVGCAELCLKTLILRDCVRLKEVEVQRFLFGLRAGECKNLRHLDISNRNNLVGSDWGRRIRPSSESLLVLRSERSDLCLMADYPSSKCGSDSSVSMDSFEDSENEQIQLSIESSEYMSENSFSSSSSSSQQDEEEVEDDEEDQYLMSQDEFFEGDLGELSRGSEQSDGIRFNLPLPSFG
ncbi:F-box protein SKIP17-like [Selaginella moellendorffii]|uniref:F-box protein SKIP17-like n=1 Tax=Selaginella moellendorffii TaxID=88036 RepID=UPI000D1CD184|nr:F-box protein SKIP17-like [Selaginella moellendorffii]|eukprot:XP_024520717.1 F-box protein SKIP17-like [Selaginella moellendorffii]